MEPLLNSAWAVVALISLSLWLRLECRSRAERRLPFLAWLMLVVILFPVISVSDDLWSIQNPAETDTSVRRDQVVSPSHTLFPVIAVVPAASFTQLEFAFERSAAPHALPLRAKDNPGLDAIQNRPPPTA